MTPVAGLLLAAGAGRRLGAPKALVRVDGEPLAERGVHLLQDAGCAPVLVVLGACSATVRRRADLGDAVVVDNEGWASGMGSSLRAGLDALVATEGAQRWTREGQTDDIGAVVVALVDQPQVRPEAVRRLIGAWRGGASLAVAGYEGRPRNPVLLDRAWWPAARRAATGDRGARGLLRAHADRVTLVECADVSSAADLDTPADLAALGGRLPTEETQPCS